jgi:hypothetical protein
MSPRIVPIPARMARLQRDGRGYPIPIIVLRDSYGRAHFTINDETKRQAIIADDSCSICAGRLLRGRWFIGGPRSAFHPDGAYIDPPMHAECAHYALQVCPYLAAPNYSRRVDARTLPKGETILTRDPTMDPKRPSEFVAVMATGQHLIRETIYAPGTGGRLRIVRFIKPRRPYTRVELWRAGAMIADDAARGEIAALIRTHAYAETTS